MWSLLSVSFASPEVGVEWRKPQSSLCSRSGWHSNPLPRGQLSLSEPILKWTTNINVKIMSIIIFYEQKLGESQATMTTKKNNLEEIRGLWFLNFQDNTILYLLHFLIFYATHVHVYSSVKPLVQDSKLINFKPLGARVYCWGGWPTLCYTAPTRPN